MDFLQLEYFLKLAKHQHVSHTANLLHISQPALSATIKKLENDLGTELFIRKGRNIALSPYGEVFKKYVEDAFLSIENGKQAITRMKNSDNTSLNLGILTPYIWNEVTHQFHNLYPEIQVNIYAIEKYDYFENLLIRNIKSALEGYDYKFVRAQARYFIEDFFLLLLSFFINVLKLSLIVAYICIFINF